MNYTLYIVLALAFFDVIYSTTASIGEGPLTVPCNLGDIECLKKSTEMFVKQTQKGIPAFNILPTDPLFIPELKVAFEGGVMRYDNRNVTITGLGNQKIHAFDMDLARGTVKLTTAADLNIYGDLTQVFPYLSKSLSGRFWSFARVLGTASYSVSLKKDNAGVEHFVVGPESTSCELVVTPKVVFTSPLSETCNDENCPEKARELWNKNVCRLVETAYVTVVHNIRAGAEVLPATAFFKNIHGY